MPLITPQQTSIARPLTSSSSTPDARSPASSGKGVDSAYRLLYRGALSLPDSYLLLDGITFSARLPNRHVSAPQDSPSCSLSRSDSAARELMHNPLALALESMRGRQSLRFKGTVCLQDVWTDDVGDVYMDIHPFATLTRVYFENMLCLSPLVAPPHDTFGTKRTQVGVRVSLGDTDGPETTDIVIYGETRASLHPPLQLSSPATSAFAGPPPLSVRVARITSVPRAPRPDDPTPRQPPTYLSSSTMFGDLGANKRILPRSRTGHDKGKAREKVKVEDQVLHRAREVMLHLPRSSVNERGKAKEKNMGQREAGFKVPELPAKARRKQAGAGTDVFGAIELPQPQSGINGKGKGKAAAVDGDVAIANPIEDANKLVLKKLAVHCLSNAGIPRSHAEFKDIFGFVYRGAAFALRSQVKTSHISPPAAEAVVEAHVKMYVLTLGGFQNASGVQEKSSPSADDAGG